ncbi:enzyme yhhN [Klebsiella michiganensis]|nr:enzyme yhhN [Klebsiella michiganensis]
MLWSFIAVCFSAWLYVDASYRGPAWRRWVFKPVTLILLLLLAWQAPMFNAISYLVLAGLCASLVGDALTLLPRQRVMYAVGAFFLSHLLYTIWFASQLTLSFFWPLPLVLLILGTLLLAIIWTRLEEMRMPVFTFIAMTLVMVWLAGSCGSPARRIPPCPASLARHPCCSATRSGSSAIIAAASALTTRSPRHFTSPGTS